MFDLDRWQEILSVLWMNKLRTVITGTSVAWAIFMMVFLMGGGNGLQNGVEFMFKDDAVNSFWIFPDATSKPWKGLPVGREIQLENEDHDRLATFEGVEHSSGRFNIGGSFNVKYKEKAQAFSVRAVHPGHLEIERTKMTHGRFITEQDNEELRKVAVIGKLVSEEFFASPEAGLGEWIDIKGGIYKVVGVFEDDGGDREMQMIYLPVKTAQMANNGGDQLDQLMLTVDEDMSVAETVVLEDKIRKDFARKFKYDPEDQRAVSIRNGIENFQRFQTLFFGIKVIITFTGLLTLLAGVIAVSNIMLITVKERTKEIGVKKALGAKPMHIIGSIIQESIFITLTSGYIGLVAGVALMWAADTALKAANMENQFFRNPEISWQMAVASLILLIIAGALGGLIPAWKAAKISPVEAMSA